ncbi:hypothetical protein Taro_009135 [Colocasia esculenta]|uniref:Growth-regulating factor n=1 Tax=Colocasia esculenta TaxID=4460 RepID=A0A843TZA9_COLES|nr:hypothetical protein [Colocasia esculenta]
MEQQQQQRQSPPPPKAARLSNAADHATTALPPPMALRLGLGPCGGGGGGRSGFTFLQLQELQHQALIYKYMAAGVPVPLQLVLPIWKSVAGSSPSSSSASPLRGQYPLPSFMGCVGGGLCFDYGSGVDPEPGRCRRTDGKKWRCSKDAVPNQKYCERHMHRGRHRSRKPVESGTSGIGGGSTVSPPAPPREALPAAATTTTNNSVTLPAGLQLMPTTAVSSSGGGGTGTGTASSQHSLGLSPISSTASDSFLRLASFRVHLSVKRKAGADIEENKGNF